MITLLILVAVLTIPLAPLLAKARAAPRRRRRTGFVAIPFQTTLALGALLNDIVISQTIFTNAFAKDIYLISVEANYSLFDQTATENPIGFGWAHSDLSVTEIAENLVAEVTDPSDIIAKERARRPVRRVGNFTGATTLINFAEGKNVRTPLKFGVTDGKQLSVWAKNLSNATLTTGSLMEVNGTVFGRWQ